MMGRTSLSGDESGTDCAGCGESRPASRAAEAMSHLRQRCEDLERQLAEERAASDAAMRIIFQAGQESARAQLGIPAQRSPRPRGRPRGLAVVWPS